MAETTDAAKMVDEKIDAAREGFGGRVRDRMGEVAEGVKTRASALRDKIRDTEWSEVTDKVTDYVKENPGKSIAIALGVGFALGLLLRRRSDD
ncbi:MAG: hypothetical protein U0529_22780 [Thermoanaerobaculia bacterium]